MNRNQKIATILIIIIIPCSILLLILVGYLEINDFKAYVMGVIIAMIIIPLTNQSLKNTNVDICYSKKIFPRYFSRPKFKTTIIDKNPRHIRGTVNISFQSEYIGKLKNGYFASEISLPENNQMNMFSQTIPHLIEDGQTVMSFCNETIEDITNRKGVLNGWKKSSYTWQWNIPYQNDMPLGEYSVKMMVFNGYIEPLYTNQDSFVIINEPSAFNRSPVN